MKLIIMSGAPGSGKSTYAQKYWLQHKNNTIIVSRDEIRFSLVGENDLYFSKENEVLNIFYETIVKKMRQGFDVIADATHLTKKSRLTLIYNISRYISSFDVVVVSMLTDLETCFERNEQRSGRSVVPRSALRRMYYSMTDPKDDDYFYKEIIYVGDKT